MVKANKRKSGEGVVDAGAGTPNKNASPKKVKIHGESPKQPKNKPMKTPIKHKTPKSPNTKASPKKKKAQKKQNSPAKKTVKLLPDELVAQLTRRQKKRLVSKVAQKLKLKGIEDFTTIDPNDASIKEICKTVVEKDTTKPEGTPAQKNKAKIMKKVVASQEADSAASDEEKPKKKPVKKTPKKN